LQDRPDEWRTMLGAAYAISHGRPGSAAELDALEDDIVAAAVRAHVDDADGRIAGRDVQEIVGMLGPARGVERLLDLGIRVGRWGDGFGAGAGEGGHALTLARIASAPNGIDLGPLAPSLERVVGHADGRIRLAPPLLLAEVGRLLEGDVAAAPGALLLVGRRNAQTNNSWLHNLPLLTKGPARCVLEMHPADAAARGFAEGDRVQVRSAVASLEVAVHITADVAPGVVVLPHGFSAGEAPLQAVAHARAVATGSVNANRLAAAGYVDVASGTVALNGFPVWCERA
jgi:hypothetical protein